MGEIIALAIVVAVFMAVRAVLSAREASRLAFKLETQDSDTLESEAEGLGLAPRRGTGGLLDHEGVVEGVGVTLTAEHGEEPLMHLVARGRMAADAPWIPASDVPLRVARNPVGGDAVPALARLDAEAVALLDGLAVPGRAATVAFERGAVEVRALARNRSGWWPEHVVPLVRLVARLAQPLSRDEVEARLLARAREDDEAHVRLHAWVALARLRPLDAEETEALGAEGLDDAVSEEVLERLDPGLRATSSPESLRPALLAWLGRPEGPLASWSLRWLVRIGEVEAAREAIAPPWEPPLLTARPPMVEALAELGPEGLAHVRALLAAEQPATRAAACFALRTYGDREDLPRLREAAEDPSESVRPVAELAIAAILARLGDGDAGALALADEGAAGGLSVAAEDGALSVAEPTDA